MQGADGRIQQVLVVVIVQEETDQPQVVWVREFPNWRMHCWQEAGKWHLQPLDRLRLSLGANLALAGSLSLARPPTYRHLQRQHVQGYQLGLRQGVDHHRLQGELRCLAVLLGHLLVLAVLPMHRL